MVSGVDLGREKITARQLEIVASSITGVKLEIWLDDLTTGKLIATIPVAATGDNNWKAFKNAVDKISGQHDVFVKFPSGTQHDLFI
jgi:hypothetical protein